MSWEDLLWYPRYQLSNATILVLIGIGYYLGVWRQRRRK